MSTYEKQLRWKKTVLSLAKAAQAKEEEEKGNSMLFTPQYYSVPLQDFEGPAKQSTDKSAQMHIARQSKARKEKREQLDRAKWTEKSKPPLSSGKQSSSWQHSQSEDDVSAQYYEGSFSNNNSNNVSKNRARSGSSNDHPDDIERRWNEDGEGEDLPVVELLEKERKEWQLERLKLIHCIHLQQIELSQRSAAAYDRATDIAKEFARAIEGFEERLIAVETNVQKEIMAIKVIAESIKTAVSGIHFPR